MQPYQLNSTDWIKQELAGLLGEQVTRDINDIIRLYSLYDGDGQRWQVETKELDYTPTVKVTNIIAELIGKEARYMMGVEPELHIVPKEKDNQAAQANADVIGIWLTALLEEQKWSKKLLDAAKDCFIMVYPEAHIWPYYTGIRDFPATSMKYPVELDVPSFTLTTTYHRRRFGRKPRTVTYLDGPFYPDHSLPPRARAQALRDEIYKTMVRRSQESDYEYIRYVKKEEKT